MSSSKSFQFKKFSIEQDKCPMKIGTDGVLLGAWANVEHCQKALDIGSGSGVIALMIAQRATGAHITAIEIDENSSKQAEHNMSTSPFAERLKLHNCSIQDFAKNANDSFDLIVCNPPFFSGGTFSNNQARKEVRHTIKLPNGDLLRCAKSLLAANGKFCVILPYIEGLRFKELAESYGLYVNKITSVRGKVDKPVERLLIEFQNNKPENCEEDDLTLQIGGRHEYSEEYVNLTREFYLNM